MLTSSLTHPAPRFPSTHRVRLAAASSAAPSTPPRPASSTGRLLAAAPTTGAHLSEPARGRPPVLDSESNLPAVALANLTRLTTPAEQWGHAGPSPADEALHLEACRVLASRAPWRQLGSPTDVSAHRPSRPGDVTGASIDLPALPHGNGCRDAIPAQLRLGLEPGDDDLLRVSGVSGVTGVSGDRVEWLIVQLLAWTHPTMQFGVTTERTHEIFTARLYGRNLGQDRVNVTGLSPVLDTVRDVVQDHRGGRGGRVYLTDTHARCAACDRVLVIDAAHHASRHF